MKSPLLDPNIRPIVEALNKEGFTTLFSCAGNHRGLPPWEKSSRGYICIQRPFDREKVLKICWALGLRRMKITDTKAWKKSGSIETSSVRFTGLRGTTTYFLERI
ncbi:hypothetical protein LCGC14_0738710 [marine sediment metagenome]|uniref:Uncharacterized protein n=1 Tax=marine sediment metagenome TaxID=412755 RepID=A0A0F9SSB6_9ZZZZ